MINHTRAYEIIDYREDMRVRFDHSRPNSTQSYSQPRRNVPPRPTTSPGPTTRTTNAINASPHRRTKIRPATDSLIHEPPAHRTPPPDNMKALLTIRAGRPDICPEHSKTLTLRILTGRTFHARHIGYYLTQQDIRMFLSRGPPYRPIWKEFCIHLIRSSGRTFTMMYTKFYIRAPPIPIHGREHQGS
jgi:hypothetical protein